MVEKVYISFRRIGNNCNYCFLYDENGKVEKRLHHKSLVKKDLESVFFSSTNNQQEIVKEALQICEKCDYKNPSVFHFLEENDIRVS